MKVIPREWLEDYFERTGDEGLCVENLVVTEWGFMSWRASGSPASIFIVQMYGDGKKWLNFLREAQVRRVEFSVKSLRRAKAVERKYGAKIKAVILELEIGSP